METNMPIRAVAWKAGAAMKTSFKPSKKSRNSLAVIASPLGGCNRRGE
jgi:hypothetical protein